MDNFQRLEKMAKELNFKPVKRDDSVELSALREFFSLWNGLHSIEGDKRSAEYKKKAQEIAEQMVAIAAEIKHIQGGLNG